MRFLTGWPALLMGKTLVIADLHIGIEAEMVRAGLRMPSHTAQLAGRIEQLIKQTGAKRLIILGDLKHKIPGTSWQERRELPDFINRLTRMVSAELVPGNHDGGITKELRGCKIKIRPAKGVRFGGCWLAHGHARLPGQAKRCRIAIISHSHPQIEFKDRLGYTWTEPVWVKGKIGRKQIIIMPAFGLVGGQAVNRQGLLGPIGRKVRIEKVYLLDGTELSLSSTK